MLAAKKSKVQLEDLTFSELLREVLLKAFAKELRECSSVDVKFLWPADDGSRLHYRVNGWVGSNHIGSEKAEIVFSKFVQAWEGDNGVKFEVPGEKDG